MAAGAPAEPPSFRVPARAALAGNPSDGYGGAVLAVPVGALSAQARFVPGATTEHVEIVAATLATFEHATGCVSDGALQWSTTIPLQVGLAGSSAIVIACLRALAHHHGLSPRPMEVAAMALAVETEQMGIGAGLQDRIAQVFGCAMFMDFGAHRFEAVREPAAASLFVAHCVRGERSGIVHGDLRAKWQSGDVAMRAAMARLAQLARDARDGCQQADRRRLGAAMTASTLTRLGLYEPDPAHVRLFELARSLGCDANFTGSGGSIVGVLPRDGEPEAAAHVVDRLRACGHGVVLV